MVKEKMQERQNIVPASLQALYIAFSQKLSRKRN